MVSGGGVARPGLLPGAGGSSISTCSGTPSSASTVSGRPRSWPRSPAPRSRAAPGSGRSRSARPPRRRRPRAATAPAASPATPVIRRQVAIAPPCRAPWPGDPPAARGQACGPVTVPDSPAPGRLTVLVCYSTVSSGYPAGKVGHDLVGDRAQGVRPLLGRGLTGVPRAEQHHLVAGLGRLGPEVDHGQVHADRAGDAPAAARGPAPRPRRRPAGVCPRRSRAGSAPGCSRPGWCSGARRTPGCRPGPA